MAVGKVGVIVLSERTEAYISLRTSVCQKERRVSRKRSLTHSPGRVRLPSYILHPYAPLTHFTEWYDIKAPSIFEVRNVGKTLVNRSQGLRKLIAGSRIFAFLITGV